MSNYEFYTGGMANPVAPKSGKDAFTFLARPGQSASEAFLLARGGFNGNGPLQVRLVDAYGGAMSSYSDVSSSYTERIKMQDVKVAADPSGFPTVVRVQARNQSTAPGSSAFVEGVGLIYD